MDGSLPGWRAPLCYCGPQILVFVFSRSRKSLPLPSKLCQQSRRCGERNHLPLSVCLCVCVCAHLCVCQRGCEPVWSNTFWCMKFFLWWMLFFLFLSNQLCIHIYSEPLCRDMLDDDTSFPWHQIVPVWSFQCEACCQAELWQDWISTVFNVISYNHNSSYWLPMAIRAESSVITLIAVIWIKVMSCVVFAGCTASRINLNEFKVSYM